MVVVAIQHNNSLINSQDVNHDQVIIPFDSIRYVDIIMFSVTLGKILQLTVTCTYLFS